MPISPHTPTQLKSLGAIFTSRAAEGYAATQTLCSSLCCLSFRASIMRRPRTGARNGGREAGTPGSGTISDSGRARPPPLAQAHGAARVPAFSRRAPGHKGLEGKPGARTAPTERVAVRSGLERTVGAGAGLAGTARSGAGWGDERRSLPAPRPRPSSTAVTASRALWGGAGAQGAGAALVAAAGRAARLHFPSRALMAELEPFPQCGGEGTPPGKPDAFPSSFLGPRTAAREQALQLGRKLWDCGSQSHS